LHPGRNADISYKGININVISKWDDNLDKLGLRPDEVKLTLTRRVANAGNGEVRDFVKVDESEYVLNKLDKSDLNIWIYTLEGLPKYDSLGGRYEYSLQDYGSGSKTFANYQIANFMKYVNAWECYSNPVHYLRIFLPLIT